MKDVEEAADTPRSGLPWAHWFTLAITQFRLHPRGFWALSFAEWQWLLNTLAAIDSADFSRDILDQLIQHYPDDPHG